MLLVVLTSFFFNALLYCLVNAEYHQLKELKRDCKFTLNNHEYDLCPVLTPYADKEITIDIERWTPPTVLHSEYRISLGGPLKKNESRHDEDQCWQGTQICLTTSTRWPAHKDEPARVTQVVPIAGSLHFEWGKNHSYTTHMNATASLAETVEGRHPAVRMRLNGGIYVRSPQRASFYFLCNHTAEEPTSPQFAWQWNGTYGFTWSSKHACGKAIKQEDPPPQSPPEQKPEQPVETPPEDQPPPDEHEGELPPEGEQGNFIPSPDDSNMKRNTTIIFFAVLSPIVLLTYLFYSPPLALRRFVLRASRRLGVSKFRASESRLVQWASQFHDIEGEGEEDFMINGRDVPEEQIPLAPSPKRTSFANYGSAA